MTASRHWPRWAGISLAAVLLSGTGCSKATTATGTPHVAAALSIERDVPLPGTTSRFDYQSLDADAHTLWIAHLGDDTVVSVDTTTDQTATITGISQVHGVLPVPQRHVVYATATGTNELVAIDPTTKAVIHRAATRSFPDGLAYDTDHQLVLVSNKADGTITVHDPETLATVRTIKLGGETGNVTYDAATHHAYAAVLPPDELVEFDPVTGDTIRTIPIHGCDGAHGIAISSNRHLAYVACENNARLAIIDLSAATVTTMMPTGSDPDVLALDTDRHRLYVAAESGDVTILDTTTREATRQHLDGGAHTVAVDPADGRVFFLLANLNGHPTLRIFTRRTHSHRAPFAGPPTTAPVSGGVVTVMQIRHVLMDMGHRFMDMAMRVTP